MPKLLLGKSFLPSNCLNILFIIVHSIHTRKMASIPTFTFFMTREGTVSSIRNFANSPLAPSLMRYKF